MWYEKINVLLVVFLTSMVHQNPFLGGSLVFDNAKFEESHQFNVGHGDLNLFYPKKPGIFEEKARIDSFEVTSPEDYPYSVIVILTFTRGRTSTCSGSLLTDTWVLTADHCFNPGHLTRVALLQVFAGGLSLQEVTSGVLSEGSQLLQSTEYYLHPLYKEKWHIFDIALIKTENRFNLTRKVNLIHLSTKPWGYKGFTSCTFTGYGDVQINEDYYEDKMRKTHMLDMKKPCPCTNLLTSQGREDEDSIVKGFICSKPRLDFGICIGDSGGGMECDNMLMGIGLEIYISHNNCTNDVSKSNLRSPKCGTKNSISMFLDTCPYLRWINKHVKLFKLGEISNECTEPKSNAYIINAGFTILITFTTLHVLNYLA